MKKFQNYLTSLPSQVYNTGQFLRYYALPYLPDPRTNPSFKEIYEGDWIKTLESRITSYINDPKLKNKQTMPTLIRALSGKVRYSQKIYTESIMSRSHQNLSELLDSTKDRDMDLILKREKEVSEQHRVLQNDYQELVHITSDLLKALSSSMSGREVLQNFRITQVSQALIQDITKRFFAINSGKRNSTQTSVNVPPRKEVERSSVQSPLTTSQADMMESIDYEALGNDLKSRDHIPELLKALLAVSSLK
jgi:hypothetical protein